MEVIGFCFCFGKIMLDLLWEMDGGDWSGVRLEVERLVRRLVIGQVKDDGQLN